ncbi:MAG TPA: amidohydrolase family protein [Thermomicrobiaceae bacterium]|nr:amidohydrolase family protein [Thermomicrobiaceae bacterium]
MTLAIKSALVIDGTGAQPIHRGIVLVDGERITAVGREADLGIPDGAQVIDLGQETILPGLVDAHTHISINPGTRGLLGQLEGLQEPDAQQGARAAHNLRLDLKSGTTTERVMPEVHFNDIAMRRSIDDGWIPGPRLLCSTRGITSSHGHGAPSWMFDGVDEIRKAVRENLQHGADFIKLLVLDRTPTEASYSLEEIQVAVVEAHRAGKLITAHAGANPGTSLRLCLEAGVDAVEHAIPETDEQIELYLRTGAAFVRTFTIMFQTQVDWAWFAGKSIEERVNVMRDIVERTVENPTSESGFADYYKLGQSLAKRVERIYEQVIPSFQRAVAQGVRWTVGMDSMHGLIGYEIGSLVEWGLSPMQAIVAATAQAAEVCGVAQDCGTLQAGKVADIISLDGDPLHDIWAIARPRFVMKGGRRLDQVSIL